MISRGAIYTPLPTHRQRESRLDSGKWIMDQIGVLAQCSQCRDYWPADTEFFDRHASVGLSSICKACCSERKLKKYYATRTAQHLKQGA